MRHLIGGWAVGTLLFWAGLMVGRKNDEFTLLDAAVILGASVVPGFIVGLAAWGFMP